MVSDKNYIWKIKAMGNDALSCGFANVDILYVTTHVAMKRV